MIHYSKGGLWCLINACKLRGSVFPASLVTAMPCGVGAGVLKYLITRYRWDSFYAVDSVLTQPQAWAGFNFLVGFLIVFRTSQAYNRFWDGCTATHKMRAEWFDACSALVAFCHYSRADPKAIMRFKNLLVRLFSMLHDAALADLEDLNNQPRTDVKAHNFDLIDVNGIDKESLETLRTSQERVQTIAVWIQLVIINSIKEGVLTIPAPLLSRAFQEIANGMVAFHDSAKISTIPFPFPYAQVCESLLMLHWCVAPFIFSQWVTEPFWAAVFVFIQAFVLWSLNYIAVEIENPFGSDANDLDGRFLQEEMNRHLLLLLRPSTMRIPDLSDEAVWSPDPRTHAFLEDHKMSLRDAWGNLQVMRKTGFAQSNAMKPRRSWKTHVPTSRLSHPEPSARPSSRSTSSLERTPSSGSSQWPSSHVNDTKSLDSRKSLESHKSLDAHQENSFAHVVSPTTFQDPGGRHSDRSDRSNGRRSARFRPGSGTIRENLKDELDEYQRAEYETNPIRATAPDRPGSLSTTATLSAPTAPRALAMPPHDPTDFLQV